MRSAEPPISSGITAASALSTVLDAARLATLPFSLVKSGIACVPAGWQLAAACAASSSFASLPNAPAYAP